MKENPYQEDRELIKELLKKLENLKHGRPQSFIEEDSFEKIVEYFEEKEEMDNALEAARLGSDQYPYSASLILKKADMLLANGLYKDALNCLDQAALLDGGDINLYILQTDAYLALDMQEKAVKVLEHALSIFTGDEKLELLFELADVYDDYEDFDKVFDCLKLILEHEPNNEEALYKICFWTDFTGRNEEGIRLHQKIIDDFPYNELAWFNLGAAFQGLKLYEKAVDAYLYAIAIDEKFDYAYRNLGDAYIRLRKYKEAIEVLEKVNELAKPEDVILEAIGHCYDRMKNFAQARFYYRKATHLRPDDGNLYYKIACTYFNEGQYQSSIKQLETALRMQKKQPEYNLLAGECYIELGFYKQAVQHISEVVRQRPRNASAWETLIRCLYKATFYDEALEQIGAAILMAGEKPLFIFYKAAVLFKLSKGKEALLHLEKALETSPRQLKKFIALNPSILQNQGVVDLLARFKKKKSI